MDPQAKTIPLHLHPLGFIEAFTALGVDLDLLLRDTQIDKAACATAAVAFLTDSKLRWFATAPFSAGPAPACKLACCSIGFISAR
jgi:hypothetical protein